MRKILFFLLFLSLAFIKTEAFTVKIIPGPDSLAAKEETKENITLQTTYPNPISEEAWLKISTKLPLKNPVLKIYDASGMEMHAQVEVSASNESENTVEFHINRGNLKRGLYFYFIMDEEKPVASGRLIVQ